MPLADPSGRIGNPRLELDADTLVADESDYRDEPYLFLDPTETDLAIADNLREFLETEVERSPLCQDSLRIQFGVGSLGNALMGALGGTDLGDRDLIYFGELIQDSAGAGRTRCGLGVRRDMEFYDHPASFPTLSERAKFPPRGLFDGDDAGTARYCINPDGDQTQELRSKEMASLDPNDIVSVQTPGGGGYGEPIERPPKKVLEDVINEKVTIKAAREEYGVVVDLENRTVDEEATEKVRAELAEEAAADGGDDE